MDQVPYKTLTTFAIVTVKPSALPRTFLDPAILGYRGPDAVILSHLAMPPTIPVYWLGMRWKGTSLLPALVLSGADKGLPNELNMSYGPQGNRFSVGVLHFFEKYGASGWPMPLPQGPCIAQQRIALSGGYGIIASPKTGGGCPGSGYLSAWAAFGKLKIFIDPDIRFAPPQQRAKYGAYNTVTGLTAILRALTRR